MNISAKLAMLKRINNKTNEEIAQATNIHIDTIKRIARGYSPDPAFSYIVAIAEFFQVPCDFFVSDDSLPNSVLRSDELEVAFLYRLLPHEIRQECFDALIERVRKWREELRNNHFTQVRNETRVLVSQLQLSEVEQLNNYIKDNYKVKE